MKEFPAFRLNAVPHHDIASASKVFSLQEFEYYLFVKVDEKFAKVYELYQVDEIVDGAEFICNCHLWEHEPYRPWYKFTSHKLNRDPGYHIYRLSFVNTYNNDTCQLYIAYVVQSNNPEKPYMYMDKTNRKCNCDEKDNS